VERIKNILESIGLEPERMEMFNLSSAMGQQFAETVKNMAEQVQNVGPSPLRLAAEGNTET
jgi:F420-non-reducing hydrogenase iron-sulfur subunit